MTTAAAVHAAHRFGLGPKPGELSVIARDPKGWLAEQVGPLPTPAALAQMPASAERLSALATTPKPFQNVPGTSAIAATEARIATDRPFAERMVAFWSNHFSVSAVRPIVKKIIGTYEAEAIRPHVFGRFEDLALAAITHPAMIDYLDNGGSIGPNSPVGRARQRTINENLARETLELYTLGVDGGYTQADVEQLALVLTGWSLTSAFTERVRTRAEKRFPGVPYRERHGHGEFFPLFHEPGNKRILGKVYREDGAGELKSVVADLARHPSTARFLATKLVRHFVSDEPPARAVAEIADVFARTGGDLAAVSRALIGLEEAWTTPLAKAKSPSDFIIAAMRGLATDTFQSNFLMAGLGTLGQGPFAAPSPQGWPDRQQAWLSPELLIRRIEWSHMIAARMREKPNPRNLLEETVGPIASRDLRRAVSGAPSAADGIALVLSSREFQRR